MCKRKIILGAFVTFVNLSPLSTDSYAMDKEEKKPAPGSINSTNQEIKDILQTYVKEFKEGFDKHNYMNAV